MSSSDKKDLHDKWPEYYDRFPYFTPDAIRDGCHPKAMEHEAAPGKAIVLVHGLTDSPYFLLAIAHHFYANFGYNVYLPLLHCHGLKEPKGMEGVELEEWKANVRFAINAAAAKAAHVSIGGLSTGGALSFFMACTKPKITGELYLFSAALDLAGGSLGVVGEMKERLLRSFLPDVLDVFDNKKPLLGRNPYRYARMDMDGAQELARLIKETDDLLDGFNAKDPFPKRVFAAHSEFDSTASIQGIRTLQKKTLPEHFTLYAIPENEEVEHASVVLEKPIYAIDAAEGEKPLEQANPRFAKMMIAVTDFERAS
ncbi:MAG: alpha/beta hydrolase [Proteobacteria bacterium]|nr:alpha/beta hydrolase [Pseudomonadota bacterium]MBU4295121.1 alpha/beta hydrolase [Pseudomonadota bacterium]MCG2746986.1 alpha/beta hydrolase [Desulfobulbaceae bacterium]